MLLPRIFNKTGDESEAQDTEESSIGINRDWQNNERADLNHWPTKSIITIKQMSAEIKGYVATCCLNPFSGWQVHAVWASISRTWGGWSV